jgi:hypothetical protein
LCNPKALYARIRDCGVQKPVAKRKAMAMSFVHQDTQETKPMLLYFPLN